MTDPVRSAPAAPKPADRGFSILGLRAEAEPLAPGLHIVATPIGNLGDMSVRAVQTLAAADAVLAEDTRVTRTLLAHYGVATRLIAYHEHNAAALRPELVRRLRGGAALALVSDAGTPLVSDPGYKLATDAVDAGVAVTAVPGASAVLAGLVVAGLPSDRFFFEGFLPVKTVARRARIAELAAIPGTLVIFEAARRTAATLADLAAGLGDRPAALARELTKRFETVRRAPLATLAAQLAAEGPPRGEVVLLVGPPVAGPAAPDQAALDARITAAMTRLSLKDAATVLAAETGLPRRTIYARALELTAGTRDAR